MLPARIFGFNEYKRNAWVASMARRVPSGSNILDVGAGNCQYRDLFAHCRYISQDLTAEYERKASGNDNSRHLSFVGDATFLPVQDMTMDVVLCTEVLEHVPEPIYVIYEIHRVLKPDGLLILTAPLGSGLHQEPLHFYGGFTIYWYQMWLTRAGFKDITIQPNEGFFRHYGQESRRFVSLLRPSGSRWSGRLAALVARLIAWPFFSVMIPLLCYFLDPLDRNKLFTVGYHVSATRL